MYTENDVKIIVAAHKEYQMPTSSMYVPMHVGAGCKDKDGNLKNLPYAKDNEGDNISELNPYFCELTGLYSAWKNIDASYIGLAHYRRHFAFRKTKNAIDGVLNFDDLKNDLGKIKIFVPKIRKYYIETLYSHYAHTFDASHLDKAKAIIDEQCPEYAASYDRVIMNSTKGYMFNMMIMQKELLNDYCEWLFSILFKLKEQVNLSGLTAFEQRLFGRVSERLFNVWLDYQIESGRVDRSEIKELPFIYTEKVNWIKKIYGFLRAKFGKKKYDQSL